MSGTGKSNSAASDAAVDSRSVAASSQASSISGISAGPSSTAMPPRGTSTLGDSSRASVWGSATCSAAAATGDLSGPRGRSEEHTSELQSLMRISYAVFCLKKKINNKTIQYYKTE